MLSMMMFFLILSGFTRSDVFYTVAFQSNGGKAIHSIDVVEGQTINLPIPTREGSTFDGWYLDLQLTITFNAANMPARDLTLYGRWIPND